MSKIFKMMGMLVLTVVFMFGFSNLGLSGYMMEPDNETHAITVETQVTVISGTLTHTETYHVDRGSGSNYAVIDYSENLRAVRSDATFNKTFKSNTGDVPNLTVSKDFSSVAVDLAGYARDTEKVGIIRVQPASGAIGWCTHCPAQVPAACEAVAMGSSVEGVLIISHTETEASVFGDTNVEIPTLFHKINAYVEDGTVMAGMVVDIMGGPFDDNPTTREYYEEHTVGSGAVVDFMKSMKYQSHIPKAGLPMPWARVP